MSAVKWIKITTDMFDNRKIKHLRRLPDGTFVWDEWLCPCCGSRFEVDYEEHDYCPNCGQHILWEVEDEQ